MSHAPAKPLFSRSWGLRQRHYFIQRMESKRLRKIGIDKKAIPRYT